MQKGKKVRQLPINNGAHFVLQEEMLLPFSVFASVFCSVPRVVVKLKRTIGYPINDSLSWMIDCLLIAVPLLSRLFNERETANAGLSWPDSLMFHEGLCSIKME
ncbi:hypothetical protein AVEN_201940-1 [Araneus ventricosus]|uniref:Uncharacterized protein n=1 Tax=Araneus ventricosus TaxID=182803 RepID=A0A4Y2SRE2_ARAVE|nr:hypothetical protein AVEN_201940-1 [Araneus ventricosus]